MIRVGLKLTTKVVPDADIKVLIRYLFYTYVRVLVRSYALIIGARRANTQRLPRTLRHLALLSHAAPFPSQVLG